MPEAYADRRGLVTGARSGFIAELARPVAAPGTHGVLAVQREDRRRALAGELEAARGIRCEFVATALTQPYAGNINMTDRSWYIYLVRVVHHQLGQMRPKQECEGMKPAGPLIACVSLLCWDASSCLAQGPGPIRPVDPVDGQIRLLRAQSPDDSAQRRQPIPAQAAIEQARGLVRQAFEDDYKTAAKNPEPLIHKLLAAAGDTKDQVRKYALLLSAEDVAAMGGDHARAMQLIDIRTAEFECDDIQSRIERLSRFLAPKAKPGPDVLLQLYAHAIETAHRGVSRDSFPQAKVAAEMAFSIAKALVTAGKAKRNGAVTADGETKQDQARALVKDIDRRSALFTAYQAALATLREREDPEAHGVVGSYLCFELGDWEKGLPFLVKSDRKELVDIASLEIEARVARQPSPEALFDVAGRWWALADGSSAGTNSAIRRHAATIYSSVRSRLSDPLDKALAEKRGSSGPVVADAGAVARKTPEGTWRWGKNVMVFYSDGRAGEFFPDMGGRPVSGTWVMRSGSVAELRLDNGYLVVCEMSDGDTLKAKCTSSERRYHEVVARRIAKTSTMWRWFNGGFLEFCADGCVNGDPACRWRREGTRVVVTWPAGWIDTLSLSSDGARLAGTNTNGHQVSGELVR